MRRRTIFEVSAFFVLVFVAAFTYLYKFRMSYAVSTYNNEQVNEAVQQMLVNRNKAIIDGNLALIRSMYDMNTKYGMWAYEYEIKKMKYIQNWEIRQGVKFVEITPTVIVRSMKQRLNNYTVNLLCSTEYKYVYEGEPGKVNTARIGTYHVLNISNTDNEWIITKEWYKDPFADSLKLDVLKDDSIKQYILSKTERDMTQIGKRRSNTVIYADKYCGAAGTQESGYSYNKKYRNYNSMGGDCANFASQIMFEGGSFRKTSGWNYDKGGATKSWLNADSFKKYMINSKRASLIAYGNYEKVYKASYNLLPGDFIAYEKKGDITHISVVTGADSKGYSLVSCHNTDRNNVPWDLGWSDKSIKFYLVRVHY